MSYVFIKIWSDGDLSIECDFCGRKEKMFRYGGDGAVPNGARAFFGCKTCGNGASIEAHRVKEYQFWFPDSSVNIYWRPCNIINPTNKKWRYMETQRRKYYPEDFPDHGLAPE